MSVPSPQWLDLERRLAELQAAPVFQQLRMMDFGPCLDQTLLCSRKLATDALDRIQRKRRKGVLVCGVKVGR
jgi:hypothetical protein